ncbi:MAG: mechanosensitive ion channel family protein [Magnetococcales bacterium]|nr:mechanosensitive ion channel family protein [Magnetococcales bacterium]
MTMRHFLLALQDVENGHPERIMDASLFLDLSGLSESDLRKRQDRASMLTRRLGKLIDRIGVKLEDIPDHAAGTSPWIFYRGQPAAAGEVQPQISLVQQKKDGPWRFSAETLKAIPRLEGQLGQKTHKQESTKVPVARRSARATMATFLKAMNKKNPDINSAITCLESGEFEGAGWESIAHRRVVELKNVIDKIRLVVLHEVPDDPNAPPYVWYTGEKGSITLAAMEEGAYKGEWRFTSSTVSTIENLYKAYEEKALVEELRARGVEETLTLGMRLERQMPQWLREGWWGLQGWQWGALLLLLIAGWIVRLVFPRLLGLMVSSLLHAKITTDREVQKRAFQSTGILAALLMILTAVHHLQLPNEYLALLAPVLKFLVTFNLVLTGYRLVDVLGAEIVANENIRLTSNDELLIPLLRKVLRLLVILVVILFIMEFWFHQPPSTVIGALGIGGVALALAAQNTLGNFFGSLTVLADRPFGIGDWIEIGDVEGTVEHVGFRSTRIRTFYNSVITVPNSRMVDSHEDNYGARRFRRIKIWLGLTYDTPPEKIEAFCEGVRELIRLHPYTRKDYYHVYFNGFGASSLDVLLYMFLETPDWPTELRERHLLFLDILRLAERLGVEFAFPTQTLWMASDPTPAPDATTTQSAPPSTTHQGIEEGIQTASELFKELHPKGAERMGAVQFPNKPLSRTRKI